MSIKIVKGSYSTTLDSANLSGDQTVMLPNASGTLTLSSQLATVATSGAYNDLSGKPTLAKVATSGSYNDLSNKPSIPSTPKGYITQTWRSGNDWYRVYSDGWIEQGGMCNSVSFYAPKTQSLHKNFTNANYFVGVTDASTSFSNSNGLYCLPWIGSRTTSSFKITNADGGGVNTLWFAIGN